MIGVWREKKPTIRALGFAEECVGGISSSSAVGRSRLRAHHRMRRPCYRYQICSRAPHLCSFSLRRYSIRTSRSFFPPLVPPFPFAAKEKKQGLVILHFSESRDRLREKLYIQGRERGRRSCRRAWRRETGEGGGAAEEWRRPCRCCCCCWYMENLPEFWRSHHHRNCYRENPQNSLISFFLSFPFLLFPFPSIYIYTHTLLYLYPEKSHLRFFCRKEIVC